MSIAEPSRRQRIIQWFADALQGIRTADGADTDAGAALFVGAVPQLGPDDPAVALAIVIGEDESRWQGEHVSLLLPIQIAALARGIDIDAWTQVERALGDIKRAIETADRTLGGLVMRQIERGPTQTLPREAGSTSSGLLITYRCPYRERWGQPQL